MTTESSEDAWSSYWAGVRRGEPPDIEDEADPSLVVLLIGGAIVVLFVLIYWAL